MRITAYSQAMNSYKSYMGSLNLSKNGGTNDYGSLLKNIGKNFAGSSGNMFEIAAQQAHFKSNESTLKAHYSSMSREELKKQFSGMKSASNGVTTSVTPSKNNANSNAQIDRNLAAAASELKTSAKNLAQSSKTQLRIGNKDDFNKENLVDGIKKFVKNYNSVVSASENTSSKSGAEAVNSMKKTTSLMKNSLDAVGIKVNNDDTLSLNEDKIKAADNKKLKSLFNSSTSYANGVAQQAARIQANASTNVSNYYNSSTFSFGAMINTYA